MYSTQQGAQLLKGMNVNVVNTKPLYLSMSRFSQVLVDFVVVHLQ